MSAKPSAINNAPASNAPSKDSTHSASSPPFTIYVADRDEKLLLPEGGLSNPSKREARCIVFDAHINDSVQPTTADMQLYRELARLDHALREVYPETTPASEASFRPYFVRLFHLAQLALEGDVECPNGKKQVGKQLSAEAAKSEIEAFANDLIEDEAPRIKNGRLRELAHWAGRLSLAFLAMYAVLMLFGGNATLVPKLGQLGIEASTAANFMLLWVGTFVGVCLSYAIRTHVFTLSDLTRANSDYLAPEIRLLLTGSFATLLALAAFAGFADLTIGSVHAKDIASKPMLAFVVGAIIGISEQKLSGTVEAKLGSLFPGSSK